MSLVGKPIKQKVMSYKFVQIEGGSMSGKLLFTEGRCDLCGKVDLFEFVDGATVMGPWANQCLPCHRRLGRGVGVGKGQRYARLAPDSWRFASVAERKAAEKASEAVRCHAAVSHNKALADLYDSGEPTE